MTAGPCVSLAKIELIIHDKRNHPPRRSEAQPHWAPGVEQVVRADQFDQWSAAQFDSPAPIVRLRKGCRIGDEVKAWIAERPGDVWRFVRARVVQEHEFEVLERLAQHAANGFREKR